MKKKNYRGPKCQHLSSTGAWMPILKTSFIHFILFFRGDDSMKFKLIKIIIYLFLYLSLQIQLLVILVLTKNRAIFGFADFGRNVCVGNAQAPRELFA